MVILTGLASATNYASNVVFGRLLPPASFGDLTALLALVVVVTVPAGAAQTIVAERIACLKAEGNEERVRYLIRHGLSHLAVLSLLSGVVAAAAIPLIDSVFDLQAVGAAIAVVPLLVVSMFIPFAWGLLQGFDRFIALGMLFFGAALSRIVFGAPWAAAGGGAGGALAGQTIGNALAVAVTLWLIRDHMIGRGTGAASSGLRRRPDSRTLAAGWAFVAFALLSNLDVVLAKVFLSPDESGEYAALATIGRIVIFLPAAVAVVMVPNVARARREQGTAGGVLRKATFVVLGTTLLAAAPIIAFPDLVVDTMFGDKYAGAAGGVRAIAVAGIGLALLYLVVVYTVAIQDRRWVSVLTAAVAVQIVAISAMHQSPTTVATVQAAVVFLALAVNEALFHPMLRSERWALGRKLASGGSR
jgi:O-antigen/teichoic acid export membrane protein